jgi:hypothetical protein
MIRVRSWNWTSDHRYAIRAAVGIGIGVALVLHQQIRHLDYVPDFGDPLFSMWRTGWVNHQLVSDPRHLFDANIFYPEHLTLTLSDSIILPALTGSPLLAAGLHPVIVYNLLLLSGFWFSGIATYLLVYELVGSHRGAFIAGLTYACSAYRFDHYSHLEMQMTQWMPLGLLALHRFISTRRWPYAIACALAMVAQLYSSMYYAVFFLVYAAAIGVGLVLIYKPPLRQVVIPIVIGAVLAAFVALPLERAFAAGAPMKGTRETKEIALYSATPSDYFRASRYSVLWRDRLRAPLAERTLFPGVAPLALAAIAAAPPLRAIPLVYVAGLLVSFDGSLGLNGTSYSFYARWFPPFRNLRAPARFGALVALSLSILAGVGATRMLRWRPSQKYQALTFVGLSALVIVEAWPELLLKPVWTEPPPLYETLKHRSRVAIAEFPLPQDETLNTPYMYFSLWHWTPMVNGYSGFIPNSYKELRSDIARFPSDDAVAALRRRGVTYVTLNCGLGYPGCDELMNEMKRARRLRLSAEVIWMGRPVQLYEILAP